jgi:hypothetical protein
MRGTIYVQFFLLLLFIYISIAAEDPIIKSGRVGPN